MRTRRLLLSTVGLGVIAATSWVGAPIAAAVQVDSSGPLEALQVNPDLSCQVRRAGDTSDAFYGDNACGTFVHVDGELFGPDVDAGPSTTTYTEVSQSGISGDGSAGNPFTITTQVSSPEGGFTISQVDRYTVGQERWFTTVNLTNTGAAGRTFAIYRAGDCYQANSDRGFGQKTGTTPACISAGGRIQQVEPYTPGNTFIESSYSAVWSAMDGNGFPNTCRCDDPNDTEHDNGVGIGWTQVLPAGGTATVEAAWFLSSPFVSFAPQRILDTRPDGVTVDHLFERGGAIQAGQTLQLQVGGRAGVAGDANSAVLNVATVNSAGAGFLTLWPCDQPQPTASSVNYFANSVRSVAVYGKLDPTGKLCIFALQTTDVIIDVNGYQPSSSSAFQTVNPARLLETRPGLTTVDGQSQGIGRVPAGSTTQLVVAGRGNVPADATAAILSVAGIYPDGPGFLTVWPCGQPQPTASNVNLNGSTDLVPNAVVSRIGTDGKVCIFNSTAMDIIADVNGYAPAAAQFNSITPARLLDTRASGTTVDGQAQGGGAIVGGSPQLSLDVAGRGGVPDGAVAVALNVTVTGAESPGFLTVWPCGTARPAASNLNYSAGLTTANLVMPGLSTGGTVCFYSLRTTDLVVDVSGYFGA